MKVRSRKTDWRLALGLTACFVFSLGSTAVAGGKTVKATKVKENTTKVLDSYGWSHSLDDLKKRAAKSGQMMFWMQIVGDLDDGL